MTGGEEMSESTTKINLNVEYRNEAVELLQMLGEMSTDERRDFLNFIQGVRFARNRKPSFDWQQA